MMEVHFHEMEPEIRAALAALRARRNTDFSRYIQAKTALLAGYLRRSQIRACVVAVSGGVDSALTLALVRAASRRPDAPPLRVIAALLPLFVPEGATNQDTALTRGREVAAAFEAEVVVVDLARAHDALLRSVDAGMGVASSPWAAGQLVSNIRTPALYHLATLLTQQGFSALICGTTNRDEGSYLGFFGKASDGMVDLQLISDLHKSEVFAASKILGVPASVLDATPTGDTYDGRPDELMIGAPYDAVELFTGLRCLGGPQRDTLTRGWSAAAQEQWHRWSSAIEALHRTNAHKYIGDSPAVHLDVLERAVPGGWRTSTPRPRKAPDHRRFVGEFSLDPATVERLLFSLSSSAAARPILPGEAAFLLPDFLSRSECEDLVSAVLAHPSVPVGVHGTVEEGTPPLPPTASRSCVFDEALAQALWARLAPLLPALREMDAFTSTDHDGHPFWRAVGLSPLFRFLRYERGGWLVPHHDATYDEGDGVHRTLMSVLIYLTEGTEEEGGATRFLLDLQRNRPVSERHFEDGHAPPASTEILLSVPPRIGTALVFDHRLPHDAQRWSGESPRVLIRTDILFARCGASALPETEKIAPVALPLEQRLGLRAGAPRAEVDRAYLLARERAAPDAELRIAWKLLRDPYYARVYSTLGTLAAADEAGFFDDGGDAAGDDPRRDTRWLVTPIQPLQRRLRSFLNRDRAEWLAVIVSTGAFCPVHRGHIRMMELAKAELERRGALVLGGYLSPSHDNYVQMKCGEHNPGAAYRVRMCQEAVDAYAAAQATQENLPEDEQRLPWLMVDPWEALHADVALNFTEVLDRLERYLSARLRTSLPVHVVYVFGSDNARFSLSFLHRGRSLCIVRPGQNEALARYREHPLLKANSRVMFAEPSPEAFDTSSRQIRQQAGGDELVPEGARALWKSWIKRATLPSRRLCLLVRDEGDFGVAHWLSCREEGAVRRARAAFFDGLLIAFRDIMGRTAPHERVDISLQVMNLDEQRTRVDEVLRGRRVLSLDPCLPGDTNLAISRSISLGDASPDPLFIERPTEARREAVAFSASGYALSPGSYVLLDDDAVSGATLDYIREDLRKTQPGVVIEEVVVASDLLCPELAGSFPREGIDVCDSRDFLVGSREGGLVVRTPGSELDRQECSRAPYLLPYVSPARRASIPVSQEIAFSRAIWQLNADFFAAITPPLLLAEAFFAFRDLMAHVGFPLDTPLETICRWHVERLR